MRQLCQRECSRSDRPCIAVSAPAKHRGGVRWREARGVPVAEVAADDEEVLGVGEEGREGGGAVLQGGAAHVAHHDGDQLDAGVEQRGDEGVV